MACLLIHLGKLSLHAAIVHFAFNWGLRCNGSCPKSVANLYRVGCLSDVPFANLHAMEQDTDGKRCP